MDFETRSRCDLRSAGAFKYSLDPSTQPTCLAFKANDEPYLGFLSFHEINRNWYGLDQGYKDQWQTWIADPDVIFVAHNAFFERCIYENIMVKRYGWPEINPRRWRCTAAKSAACALPRKLESVGEALNLTTQKDKRGYVAMMATCKPTRAYNDWAKARAEIKAGKRVGSRKINLARKPEPPVFLEPEAAPKVWRTLYTYCKIDVKTEELLDRTLPDLTPEEQENWFHNQEQNWRGLHVDIETTKKILDIMALEKEENLKELDALTIGLISKAGAIKSILEFLREEGVDLPDLRAKTVNDVLKDGKLTPDGKKLLEIRKALSKTSTRKYQAFLNRANDDDCVRDILLFHAAHTGRDGGTGVQPQNFPKPVLTIPRSNPYQLVDDINRFDSDSLKLFYGEDLSPLFSSVLRNMILPNKTYELFVGDFSKIEVVVLWWLANNVPGLKILSSGKDPYKYQAAENTGKNYDDIEDDGDDRQLGKAQILGCGFGMGWLKFQTTAWDFYRLKLTDTQAKNAVKAYREANKAVTIMWRKYEDAAIMAVEKKRYVAVNKCKFFTKDKFLWIELPSGRRLAYREPRITMRASEYGDKKTLEFMAVNSKTKKWSLERTWGGTLTENIVQAVARDLMKTSERKLKSANYRVLCTVHDEIISERKIGRGSVSEFIKIMCDKPKWAGDLPLEAKGWSGLRYKKG